MPRGQKGGPPSSLSGMPDMGDVMNLDEGEEVSPAEIAGVLSELGLDKPKPKPKAAAGSGTAAARQAIPAKATSGGPAAGSGPAAGPSTAFDLVRSRLEEYQRAAVLAKQGGDMGRAVKLLHRFG